MVTTPAPESLADIIDEMRTWAYDPDRALLHVGDLGWNQQFGAAALAAALRVWRRDDRLAAVGLLDEPDLLRLVVAPEHCRDEGFIHQLVADIGAGDGRVLPPGEVAVERYVNPRIEAEDHYYNASNRKLLDLGLKPHLLGEELVRSLLQIIGRYRDRVITRAIEPSVRWRPEEVSSGTAAE